MWVNESSKPHHYGLLSVALLALLKRTQAGTMAGPVTSVGALSVNSASGSVMVQQPSARRMLPATWRTFQSG